MARTSSSTRKVVLPNGNRVTITTRATQSGFSKTVTVRRPDGSSQSQTYRRKFGFVDAFLWGSMPYKDDIPGWALK